MATEPFDPDDIGALERRIAELKVARQARVDGSGAIAQDGGTALGARAAQIRRDNLGTVITGTQIVNHYLAAGGTPLDRQAIAHKVAGYLRWLRERTQNIELRGIERAGGAPVVMLPLETAYVPLRARPMARAGEPRDGLSPKRRPKRRRPADAGDARGSERAGEREADIALNQVLGLGRRLAIIGGPGCGKTTVLLHMAWALASSLLDARAEPARSRLGLKMAPSALPLPIFVPLASFARHRRHVPAGAPAHEKTLAHFISHHLIRKQADFGLPADFFVQLLKDGRDVLLLLDGLDEVADEGQRAEVRQSVEELVSGREAMRTLVTCRTVAYRNGRTALGADFREIAVQPLDAEQHIAPMVRQAYACIHPRDAVSAAERADNLLAGIAQLEHNRRARLGDDAGALVGSPLMVRLLLIVHMNNRRLPDERADLFDKAINALLQVDYGREESDIGELSADWKLYRDMAQHLAFHMHRQGPDQGRDIDETALKAALRQDADFRPHIDAFLSHARQRGSVIEERDGAYRFIHLAFQEFLVARHLREVVGAEGRDAILAFLHDRLDDAWWREPVLLLAGYWAVHAARPARAFIAALGASGTTPDARFCAAEIAGTAALEWHTSGDAIRADCARRIVGLLRDAQALEHSKPVLRARAGDVLSHLGDPRFDPKRFYLPADKTLGFVRIAADPAFRIGTRRADKARVEKIIGTEVSDDEINDAPTPTPEFHIARYPVTVAQFRAFVEATQFRLGDEDALLDPDSRPVRWVDWYEAMAYCAWLNDMLSGAPEFADCTVAHLVREQGWRVALPSELEWEKAAHGGLVDAVFSWGDTPDPQRANYGDSGVRGTSAVGCFAANGYGLHDMLGNVREWTRSVYSAYPYRLDDPRHESPAAGDDETVRVMRGGSSSFSHDLARCANRLWSRPSLRYLFLGFRVVLRSAPVF